MIVEEGSRLREQSDKYFGAADADGLLLYGRTRSDNG